MKKIISIALVAALILTSAFAGFKGSAAIGLGYNFETGANGFSNSKSASLTYEITSGKVAIPAAPAEGEEAPALPAVYAAAKGEFAWNEKGISASVKEAFIQGENWKVSILGAADGLNYASSPVSHNYYDATEKAAKAVSTFGEVEAAKAPGFTAEYDGWKIGVGYYDTPAEEVKTEVKNNKGMTAVNEYHYFATAADATSSANLQKYYGTAEAWTKFKKDAGDAAKNWILVSTETVGYKAGLTTKPLKEAHGGTSPVAYELVADDVVKVGETTAIVDKLDYSVFFETKELAFADFKVKAGAIIADVSDAKTGAYLEDANVGLSAKVSYASEEIGIKASVATDLILDKVFADQKIDNFDIAAKVAYEPVAVDAYFVKHAVAQAGTSVNRPVKETKDNAVADNYLAVKAAADLKDFAPVKVTVIGKNLINDAKILEVAPSATFGKVTVGADFEYGLAAKDWAATANVTYAADMFTAKCSATYLSSEQLYASASISSSKLIEGATLSLAYAPIANAKTGIIETDLLAGEKYGKIDATCTIAF